MSTNSTERPGARDQRKRASTRQRPATERTLELLKTLANKGRPVSLKELALSMQLPIATAFRHCRRLEEEGYLVRDSGTRRYAIGVRLMRLGLDILRASGPTTARNAILSEIVETIGETCNLTALAGTEVVYLDRVETRWPLRLTLEPGSRVPIHCTASGKLFLSCMNDELRNQVLSSIPLNAYAEKTITDRTQLDRQLDRIARRGFSTDDEEFLVGLNAVAVPVRDAKGTTFAAIACHAPVARLDLKALIAHVPLLEAASARIAQTFE